MFKSLGFCETLLQSAQESKICNENHIRFFRLNRNAQIFFDKSGEKKIRKFQKIIQAKKTDDFGPALHTKIDHRSKAGDDENSLL